jgi:putative transposase
MQKLPTNFSPRAVSAGSHTFFVTAKTSQGKALLQSDRMATLFIDVLRSYQRDTRMKVHEFVIMRNYFQLLISVNGETTIDEAVRRIKGRFAYRAALSFGIRDWIWDRDISAVAVRDRAGFLKHKGAMEQNPVNAALAESADAYPYCSAYLRKNKSLAKTAGF